jgi:hypothetical protein
MRYRTLLMPTAFYFLVNVSLAQSPEGVAEKRAGMESVSSRFTASFTLPTEKGLAQSYDVSLGKMLLQGARRIEAPLMGYYVATLIAGELVTNIADRAMQRHPGDSWAVNAGEAMAVQLQGKSKNALLQIFTVKEAGQKN